MQSDDVTVEHMRIYRAAGVSRVSIGVQSMVRVLASSAAHSPRQRGGRGRGGASCGHPTFNLDLIYGAAGERLEDWQATLAAAGAGAAAHLRLRPHGGSRHPAGDGHCSPPDDDDLADKYEAADDALTAAGLANYEVSNWAMPAHECRHNVLYWQQGDYLGFGSAAHSHRVGRRWWNLRTPERYIAAVMAGEPTEAAGETLDDETRRIEGLQLALRMRDGVPRGALDADGLDDLVVDDGERVRLTRAGRLLANEVSLRLR